MMIAILSIAHSASVQLWMGMDIVGFARPPLIAILTKSAAIFFALLVKEIYIVFQISPVSMGNVVVYQT